MDPFELFILGCGSATPTRRHSPTAQILRHRSHDYLIDCGEGTQLKLRHLSISIQAIEHIFISHLHGDHYFGLPGLLSTMQMLGRKKLIHIYAHEELKELMMAQMRITGQYLRFPLEWHIIPKNSEFQKIADLPGLEVFTFPLKHSIATNGFLFREAEKERNIRPECIERYDIPYVRIRQIKQGADYTLADGTVIANEELTLDPPPRRSYAFCSDTAFAEATAGYVTGVDLLYHESTFLEGERARARKTMHSTARDAAEVARSAGAGELLLGHFSARYRGLEAFAREAEEVFPAVRIAEEGTSYPIGPVQK